MIALKPRQSCAFGKAMGTPLLIIIAILPLQSLGWVGSRSSEEPGGASSSSDQDYGVPDDYQPQRADVNDDYLVYNNNGASSNSNKMEQEARAPKQEWMTATTEANKDYTEEAPKRRKMRIVKKKKAKVKRRKLVNHNLFPLKTQSNNRDGNNNDDDKENSNKDNEESSDYERYDKEGETHEEEGEDYTEGSGGNERYVNNLINRLKTKRKLQQGNRALNNEIMSNGPQIQKNIATNPSVQVTQVTTSPSLGQTTMSSDETNSGDVDSGDQIPDQEFSADEEDGNTEFSGANEHDAEFSGAKENDTEFSGATENDAEFSGDTEFSGSVSSSTTATSSPTVTTSSSLATTLSSPTKSVLSNTNPSNKSLVDITIWDSSKPSVEDPLESRENLGEEGKSGQNVGRKGESLPDLEISVEELENSARLDLVPLPELECALKEQCLTRSALTAPKFSSRSLLRFSVAAHNMGDAPFRPHGHRREWEFHTCHAHLKPNKAFAHYDVLSASTRAPVSETTRVSFCLEDSVCKREALRPKFTCGGDQGISAGCSDVFDYTIDCQWMDVTDLKAGQYLLSVHVNPEQSVRESDFDNNVAECRLVLSRNRRKYGIADAVDSAEIRNCTLGRIKINNA